MPAANCMAIKQPNVSLIKVLEKNLGDDKSHWSSSGSLTFVDKFMEIHEIVIEIFHAGPKWGLMLPSP